MSRRAPTWGPQTSSGVPAHEIAKARPPRPRPGRPDQRCALGALPLADLEDGAVGEPVGVARRIWLPSSVRPAQQLDRADARAVEYGISFVRGRTTGTPQPRVNEPRRHGIGRATSAMSRPRGRLLPPCSRATGKPRNRRAPTRPHRVLFPFLATTSRKRAKPRGKTW
jgi:hypothetical protein